MSYRITENLEKEEIVLPARVQKLVDLYAKAGENIGGNDNKKYECRYTFSTEDLIEKVFEDKLRLASKPGSLKILITAIYRIRHNEKEFYIFNYSKSFKNKLDNLELFSLDGCSHYLAPVIGMRFNEQKGISLPEIVKYEHYFDQPWNKEEVKSLLSKSSVACEDFYVGKSNPIVSSESIASPYYKIESETDFLSGSFDDLWDMGRLGISYKEPSLYMVEAARQTEKNNREASWGMGRKPNKVYT